MAILLSLSGKQPDKLIQAFQRYSEKSAIRLPAIFTEVSEEQVDIVKAVVSWKHPHGLLRRFKNLAFIASYGAGVDGVIADPDLPDVPVTRLVDPGLKHQMARFVIWAVMEHELNARQMRHQQQQQQWLDVPRTTVNKITVLGLGELGAYVASQLAGLGFEVSGWSRSAKNLPDVVSYSGNQGLKEALTGADIVINLLPLTTALVGILNKDTLSLMAKGSYLINVARGAHLEEADLVTLINEGHLAGACLDVVRQEPLSGSSPLWSMKGVTISPHVASLSSLDELAKQVMINYDNVMNGKPLHYTISRHHGY